MGVTYDNNGRLRELVNRATRSKMLTDTGDQDALLEIVNVSLCCSKRPFRKD